MIPKKIYLNYVDENDTDKTWSDEAVSVYDCKMNNREYTDLSQVWHGVNEIPNQYQWVICELYDEDPDTAYELFFSAGLDLIAWERKTTMKDVIRWAYIKDLLPN